MTDTQDREALDLDAIRADLDRRVPARDVTDRGHCRVLLHEVERLRAEVERLRERMPCDGGCNPNSGPEETCSLHGRPVREVWDAVDTISAQRDRLRAGIEALASGPGSRFPYVPVTDLRALLDGEVRS